MYQNALIYHQRAFDHYHLLLLIILVDNKG